MLNNCVFLLFNMLRGVVYTQIHNNFILVRWNGQPTLSLIVYNKFISQHFVHTFRYMNRHIFSVFLAQYQTGRYSVCSHSVTLEPSLKSCIVKNLLWWKTVRWIYDGTNTSHDTSFLSVLLIHIYILIQSGLHQPHSRILF